jgi:hypothetical protein
MTLPGGEPAEHVGYRNPHMADARPAATLARLDRDDVLVVRAKKPSPNLGSAQQRFAQRFAWIAARKRFPLGLSGLAEGYDKLP